MVVSNRNLLFQGSIFQVVSGEGFFMHLWNSPTSWGFRCTATHSTDVNQIYAFLVPAIIVWSHTKDPPCFGGAGFFQRCSPHLWGLDLCKYQVYVQHSVPHTPKKHTAWISPRYSFQYKKQNRQLVSHLLFATHHHHHHDHHHHHHHHHLAVSPRPNPTTPTISCMANSRAAAGAAAKFGWGGNWPMVSGHEWTRARELGPQEMVASRARKDSQ